MNVAQLPFPGYTEVDLIYHNRMQIKVYLENYYPHDVLFLHITVNWNQRVRRKVLTGRCFTCTHLLSKSNTK